MNEMHYGYIVNTHYDAINMLTKMQQNNPRRFKEFEYSTATIYHHIDRLNQEQNIYD
jgi:hypothetical protein